ncbi:MAG TPA: SDR family oxidoreductase [Acidimicrobiales bacterium]|jgi:NAD(P)-dependent dehydrogenase (short-subunit alcohol dehydrogenase family)|nr:SDR family oxidoreductase [Acidimicrobiales bacterium]
MLVTGSGRNIGRAIVLEFARRGANVIINARSNVDEARAVASEAQAFGARTLVVMGEAADPAVVDEMKTRAEDEFGRVDMYVSNAARRPYKDFWETTNEDWHHFLNQQLSASWYLAKAFAPGMRDAGFGRIIHVNGPDGFVGGWTRIPHSTAKGGLRALTKSLAAGLGRYGITVNDINPGYTETIRDPETHPFLIGEEARQRTISRIPIGRGTKPEELAFACAFLCSAPAMCITGSIIHVDGGMSMLG